MVFTFTGPGELLRPLVFFPLGRDNFLAVEETDARAIPVTADGIELSFTASADNNLTRARRIMVALSTIGLQKILL